VLGDDRLAHGGVREAAVGEPQPQLPRPGAPPAARPAPCVLVPDSLWHRDPGQVGAITGDFAAAGVAVRLDFVELGPLRTMVKNDIPRGLSGIRLGGQQVRDLEDDSVGVGGAILAGIVRFADLMHLSVAARGVDTPAQLAAVRALGCDLAQGAAIGRAVPTPPW
jgi:hypothetical protein